MPVAQGNVRELRPNHLPPIGVAATAGTGNRIGGSRNEIWLCPAFNRHQEPVMVYLKLGLSTRKMMVEALCAQLAHCIGLDTPPPYLVTVNPRHVGRPAGPSALVFGAEDLATRSMARPMQALEPLLDLLRRMKLDDLSCAFDEWIGNDVRSPSDILVSPESRIYLIDHEAALAEGMDVDASVTNWLAQRLVEGLDVDGRMALLRRVRGRIAALHRVALGPVPLAAQYSQDGVPIYESLVKFLAERLAYVDQLLSQRIVPEQGYLKPAPTPLQTDSAATP
jgi:hypothetical protein